jgi:CO/xanthine dehydrogenase Mo-binding subunit
MVPMMPAIANEVYKAVGARLESLPLSVEKK